MGNINLCNCRCGQKYHQDAEEFFNPMNYENEDLEDKETSNKNKNNNAPLLKRKLNKRNISTLKGNYSFMDDPKNNISFDDDNNKSFMTDPITSSRKDYKYRQYDSLDSIILNQILKNDNEKEKEFPIILNNDLDINNSFQNGNKENQILINPEININELDNNKNVKKLNPDILKLFDIPNNNNLKLRNKKNNINNNINNDNLNNFSNSQILNEINNLNDIFKIENRDLNNKINIKWKQMNINNIILNKKINPKNKDEIIYKGNLNKLVLSHIFKNCLMNIEKFCFINQESFFIYHNKENFLFKKKPLIQIYLNQIEKCGRIDFSKLKIHNLKGYFYMFINLKSDDEKYNLENNEKGEEIISKIILKEENRKFFVLFSSNEKLIDEWVCTINFLIQKIQN